MALYGGVTLLSQYLITYEHCHNAYKYWAGEYTPGLLLCTLKKAQFFFPNLALVQQTFGQRLQWRSFMEESINNVWKNFLSLIGTFFILVQLFFNVSKSIVKESWGLITSHSHMWMKQNTYYRPRNRSSMMACQLLQQALDEHWSWWGVSSTPQNYCWSKSPQRQCRTRQWSPKWLWWHLIQKRTKSRCHGWWMMCRTFQRAQRRTMMGLSLLNFLCLYSAH